MNEEELKPLLTNDFLARLAETAKVCGWSIDHVATLDFVKWCHDLAGKECPDLTPYD